MYYKSNKALESWLGAYSDYSGLMYCQYKALVTTTCTDLNKFANDTYNNISAVLLEMCQDVLVTDTASTVTQLNTEATTASLGLHTTESVECVEEKRQVEACAETLRQELEEFTAMDWRDDGKVDALCR